MRTFLVTILTLLLTDVCLGSWCSTWGKPQTLWSLDQRSIAENSGMAVSIKYKKIYHINDSGEGPYFYSTKLNGTEIKKIELENVTFTDTEALSLGPCMGQTCLFIGDIGDNLVVRPSVKIHMVKEEDFGSKVKVFKTLEFSYPDGSHNAEGMAVHPNGDIFIVTKDVNHPKGKVKPVRFYKIGYSEWQMQSTLKANFIGEIDISAIQRAPKIYRDLATGLDISRDGNRFFIMTYWDAFEFKIDLSKASAETFKKLKPIQYKQIPIKHMIQQESISYLPDEYAFIYTTEYQKDNPLEVVKVKCNQIKP